VGAASVREQAHRRPPSAEHLQSICNDDKTHSTATDTGVRRTQARRGAAGTPKK
jgi:hypothetical protein